MVAGFRFGLRPRSRCMLLSQRGSSQRQQCVLSAVCDDEAESFGKKRKHVLIYTPGFPAILTAHHWAGSTRHRSRGPQGQGSHPGSCVWSSAALSFSSEIKNLHCCVFTFTHSYTQKLYSEHVDHGTAVSVRSTQEWRLWQPETHWTQTKTVWEHAVFLQDLQSPIKHTESVSTCTAQLTDLTPERKLRIRILF